METVLRALGTSDIFAICEADLRYIAEAFAAIEAFDDGALARDALTATLYELGGAMHNHSYKFRPLVETTVDFLLMVATAILLLKGFILIVTTVVSSRSIVGHYDDLARLSEDLTAKNHVLHRTIDALEDQKQQKHAIVAAQKAAEHSALHDALAALPNRRFFDQRLAEQTAGDTPIAVFLIDIDNFKTVNDSHGHPFGDHVLVEVAARLKRVAGPKDFVARLGGDEFAVIAELSPAEPADDQAHFFADRIVDSLDALIRQGPHEWRLSGSVGAATLAPCSAPDRLAEDAHDKSILARADRALYRAKQNGRNGYALYDAALHAEVTARNNRIAAISKALERGEIVPFYQPQIDPRTMALVGVEALARWRHPDEGILAPASFLDIAEEMGVTAEIDRMIFEAALADFEQWRALGLEVPRFSVNVSFDRLLTGELIEDLEGRRLAPGTVTFEILESTFMDNADDALRGILRRLDDIGVDLELDDFGSGHSSIIALLALKPKRFKIDRHLVAAIDSSPSQRALVESIIDIGKSQNLEVVAEGVATPAHFEILREVQCDVLQGSLFSAPISSEDFIEFVRRKSWVGRVADAAPALFMRTSAGGPAAASQPTAAPPIAAPPIP